MGTRQKKKITILRMSTVLAATTESELIINMKHSMLRKQGSWALIEKEGA